MKINLGEVLSKAGRIIWKFKVLWVFGILAGCGGANSGNFNFSNSSWRGNSGNFPNFLRPLNNLRFGQIMQSFLNRFGGIIAGVILLLCLLWIVFYFLGVIGKTGLIKGSSKADAGASTMSFGEIWTESTPYFWRMFGLNVLVGLPFLLLIAILLTGIGFAGYATYINGNTGSDLFAVMVGLAGVIIAAICVISIFSIIVGMILEQAQNAIVLENLGVFAGLGRGWNVFKSAIVTIVVMAIILAIIGWVANLLIAIPLIAVAVPAVIGMAAVGDHNTIVPLIIAAGCFVVYLPFLLVLKGVLISYTQSVWTLVYRRLTVSPTPAVVDAIKAD
jgi:hypothetical protein